MTIFAKDYTNRLLEGKAAYTFKAINAVLTLVPLTIVTWVLVSLFQVTWCVCLCPASKQLLLSRLRVGSIPQNSRDSRKSPRIFAGQNEGLGWRVFNLGRGGQ